MADDPNQPVILTTRRTEAQAALIVAALRDRGVEAQATGGFTSSFRAEAPGDVRILVRRSDLERAREALRAIEAPPKDTG
jgi:type III secretory pathway lipoprotein EscJ